eukprot:3811947-Rhodomonas_salina.1
MSEREEVSSHGKRVAMKQGREVEEVDTRWGKRTRRQAQWAGLGRGCVGGIREIMVGTEEVWCRMRRGRRFGAG